jgi:prevent-host-death family protein
MPKVPETAPISDLRRDASAILKRVGSSRDPLVITERDRATAVMLNLDAYEQLEEERQILLALARGEGELQAGKGFSLDAVLREADRLLKNS